MRSRNAAHPQCLIPSLGKRCLCLLLALFLTGCGTFQILVEPELSASDAPSPAAPDTTAVDPPAEGPPTDAAPTPSLAAISSDIPPTMTAAPGDWAARPPGLVYRTMDTLWQINQDEQPVALGNYEAILSPDGQRLLSYDFAGQDIWFHDLNGGPSRQLTYTPSRTECCFSWWPQRPDLILFSSAAADREPQPGVMGYLTMVELESGSYRILDDQHDIGPTGFDLSPNGQSIAYGGGEQGWIYHLGVGPEPFDPADYGLTGSKSVQIGSPAWSPDGTKLAWMVAGGFGPDGAYRMAIGIFDLVSGTADLRHPYEPMGRGGWPEAPVWSPDGQWLAFAAGPVNMEEAGVWVVPASGGETQAHHFGYGGTPVWSPDGQWLAFTHFSDEGVPGLLAAQTGSWQTREINLAPGGSYYLMGWTPLQP